MLIKKHPRKKHTFCVGELICRYRDKILLLRKSQGIWEAEKAGFLTAVTIVCEIGELRAFRRLMDSAAAHAA